MLMQFFMGCSTSPTGTVAQSTDIKPMPQMKKPIVAALLPLPADQKSLWKLPENLVTEGKETLSRVVTGAGLLAPQALELATGAQARSEYFVQLDGSADELAYRFSVSVDTGRRSSQHHGFCERRTPPGHGRLCFYRRHAGAAGTVGLV